MKSLKISIPPRVAFWIIVAFVAVNYPEAVEPLSALVQAIPSTD